MTPDKLDQLRKFATVAKQGPDGVLGSIVNAVPVLCDEIEKLTAERDTAKGLLAGLHKEMRTAITERGKAERERDEARAELERVRELAARWAECAPPDEWPDSGNLADSIQSDYGRAVLAALDGEGT